ncbi:hypothetical protein ON010_g10935 [Phytophthora cinnamomi]|nr:hypothetical protein ON010_g10935 [Phytophthora cinnamomi]
MSIRAQAPAVATTCTSSKSLLSYLVSAVKSPGQADNTVATTGREKLLLFDRPGNAVTRWLHLAPRCKEPSRTGIQPRSPAPGYRCARRAYRVWSVTNSAVLQLGVISTAPQRPGAACMFWSSLRPRRQSAPATTGLKLSPQPPRVQLHSTTVQPI